MIGTQTISLIETIFGKTNKQRMDIRFSKEDNKEEINNEELQVKEHQAY